MAEADKDDRMAQWLSDSLTCLGMEIAESIRAASEHLERECPICLPPAVPEGGRDDG